MVNRYSVALIEVLILVACALLIPTEWMAVRERMALWFKLGKPNKHAKKKGDETTKFLINLIVALLLGVIPMPVTFRWLGWFSCWVICLFIFNSHKQISRLPKPTRGAVGALLVIAFCVLFNSRALSMWKEEKAGIFSGVLKVRRSWLSTKPYFPDSDIKVQFGPGGIPIMLPNSDLSPPRSKLWVTREGGDLLLTADVRDKHNDLIVRVKDNAWEINPNNSWDHNYTEDSLEVKDRTGRVVLKTAVFDDRLQIEGEWWNEDEVGWRMLRPYPYDKVKRGPVFVKMSPSFDPDEPSIREMFLYPSRLHFGEYNAGEYSYSRSPWAHKIFIFQVSGVN
jgi:hypothetical protein